MPQRKDPYPYRQIADELTARIDSGEFAPGDRLPSVRDLMEIYRVSHGTARDALAVLRAEGRTRTSNQGTFLADTPTVSSPAERLRRINSGGRLGRLGEHYVILFAGRDQTPPEQVRDRLELTEGQAPGLRTYVTYDRDDRPVAYGKAWTRPEIWDGVPELGIAEPLPSGGIGAIHARLGVKTVSIRELHMARTATDVERELLRLPEGSCVLEVIAMCLAFDNSLTEYNVTVHPSGYIVSA